MQDASEQKVLALGAPSAPSADLVPGDRKRGYYVNGSVH